MTRKTVRVLAIAVAAVVTAAWMGVALHAKFTRVETDLAPLAPYAASQNYAALISSVRRTPEVSEGFSFVVLGDTRSNLEVARRVLARAREEHPAFILHTGDLVGHGAVEEYLSHHVPLIKEIAPIPLIPVPGNHEAGPNTDFAAFAALYGGLHFSFDFADCRFVGINNGDEDGVSRNDLAFLREELGKPGVKQKFVMLHVPPLYLEASLHSTDERGFRTNASAFRKLMAEMKVDAVFAGHVHGYAAETLDGVRYIITGGGGAPLTQTLGAEGKVHNFVLVHVAPSGMTWEVFRLRGEEWVQSDIP
jgi:predicted phosphodiesterase